MVTKLSLSMVSVSDDTGAIFPRENAKALALAIGRAKTVRECQRLIKNAIEGLPTSGEGSSWFHTGSRLVKWLNRPTRNKLPFAVFARGNGKLPFYAFSALPFATCPGMGACEHFCYSPRSWRVAPPFFRQIQNTILARFFPGIIATRFFALPQSVVLRLFVDGDFHDTGAVRFWMGALKIRPDIRAYGYSKSWDQLSEYQRQGGAFPNNYILTYRLAGANKRQARIPCGRLFRIVDTPWRVARLLPFRSILSFCVVETSAIPSAPIMMRFGKARGRLDIPRCFPVLANVGNASKARTGADIPTRVGIGAFKA